MAPPWEKEQLARGVIAYMAEISQQTSSRWDKKIAGSPELRDFLSHLADRVPSAMDKLLKSVGRRCADALRREKQTQNAKKRAASSKCHDRNAKRHKKSFAIKVEATQQVGVDGDEEVLTKNETPSPQSNAQCLETALPNTSFPDMNGVSRSKTVVVPTMYEIESGLTMGSSAVETYVKASLLALRPSTTRANFNINDEIAKVWKIIPFLEFYKTRSELGRHLENREKIPDGKLQSSTVWNSSDPGEILDKLENVRMSTIDNRIHRAYGQTILVSSVDAQVAKGYESIVTDPRSDYKAILEDLACKKAGPLSNAELDQIKASYLYEYQTGQKWLAVSDWFGGSGTVLVFILAGIGPRHLKQWTEFQKSCVQHIAGLLHSIRRLIETLGPDALERYCRHGRLGNNCLDRLKSARFAQPDGDEGCEDTDEGSEDGAGESEDEDEGSKDKDGELGDAEEGSKDKEGEFEDADEGSKDGFN